MKFLKLTHALLAAVLLAAAVSSCGDGDDDDDDEEEYPWENPGGGGNEGGNGGGNGGGGSNPEIIRMSPSEVLIPAKGGNVSVSVTAGGPITRAQSGESWVSSSISGGYLLTVSAGPNTGASRGCNVFVDNATGGMGSIVVRQSAGSGGSSDPGTNPDPGTSAPAAPTGLYVADTGSAGAPNCIIKWNAPQGATSYLIYRSTSESSGYSQIGTSQYASYADQTVKVGNTYYYRVKAKNAKGTSDYSNTCRYEFSDTRKPGPAKITSATCSGSNITVRWSVPTDKTYGKPTSGSIRVADPQNGGTAVEVKSFSASTTSATFNYRPYVASSTGGVNFVVRLTKQHGYSEKAVIYNSKSNEFYY